MPTPLQPIIERYGAALNQELRAAVPADSLGIWHMLRYHMGWEEQDGAATSANPGKQIRPYLVLLACEAASGHPAQALPFAAAVELLHNFSLIHDDIEDGSLERRHRPTVWAIWGEPQGINAGDAMHVLARAALHRAVERGISAEVTLAGSMVLDRTSVDLCRGQYLDMAFESRDQVSTDAYLEMIGGKTAALIGAALELGVLAAGREDLRAGALEGGRALGMAFQIHDDLLGIWGAVDKTGKSASSDIASRKKSFPVLFAMEDPECGPRLRQLYGHPSSHDDCEEIVGILDAARARQATEALAGQYRDRGLAQLDLVFGERAATLRDLALFLTERDH